MKHLVIALIGLSLVTACQPVKRVAEAVGGPEVKSGFVPNLPDVPLPENFVIDESTSTFFDSAEGRIAEVNAQGISSVSEVNGFYDSSMPALGWTRIGNLAYKKEGELLVITPEQGNNLTNLKFSLRPSL